MNRLGMDSIPSFRDPVNPAQAHGGCGKENDASMTSSLKGTDPPPPIKPGTDSATYCMQMPATPVDAGGDCGASKRYIAELEGMLQREQRERRKSDQMVSELKAKLHAVEEENAQLRAQLSQSLDDRSVRNQSQSSSGTPWRPASSDGLKEVT